MDQNRDWIVYQREDGQWAKKISGAKNAYSVHPKQEHAENSAREMLKIRGGGKLFVEGFDGKLRSQDSFLQTVVQGLFRSRQTDS